MTDSSTRPTTEQLLGIADVERDTGIGKDTLRVWERRYGFPVPLRDEYGERRYSREQIQRLRLIRRLMDSGLRPSKLMALSLEELESRLGECPAMPPVESAIQDVAEGLFMLACNRELAPLRSSLSQILARQGLQRFVIDVLPCLLERVGQGWLRGEIGVAEEHILTETLQNLLRATIHALPQHSIRHPTVLLTTLPEEDHGLGLLMVEALLESEQANCLPLGLRTPLPDIVDACHWAHIEIVAISVSAAYAPNKALKSLITLREMLPEHVELWAGGAGTWQHSKTLEKLPNTRSIAHIADILQVLADWHLRRLPNNSGAPAD